MKEFWGDDHYHHPPLTDSMIAEAERLLGRRLPASYVELLKERNGGYTRGFAFPMDEPTTWAADHVPLEMLAGIVVGKRVADGLSILDSQKLSLEWELPPDQILLCGDGHWWITLDYRDGDEPVVSWIDVECDEDIVVAESFDEFLAGLRPIEEFE